MSASKKRQTKETSIEVFLDTEGSGTIQIDTGIVLLDEILSAMARGAGFDLTVKARGDLETGDHHTTEDTAITLGSALAQEIKNGIGSSTVPSGLAVTTAAVRFGDPGYRGNFALQSQALGGMSLENFSHFLRALAYNGRFNLFISAEGGDDRSKIEAMSTALGRAIKKAVRDR
ncbi:MAG: imidazoleglycerol-phosphate dehydratase [Methanothrix sp.]|nr:imidazoleglycerol-phosphate dehydratase [Methanothrix sp.]MDD4447460.1 imidazoleglycerol-phosphate dehydratase [Methanothrix sp.]